MVKRSFMARLGRTQPQPLLGTPSPPAATTLPEGLRQLREGDQDYPAINGLPSMHEKAITDVEARKAIGIQRYGVALQPANGRNAVRDWYEEALDGVVYGAQVAWEQDHPSETYVGCLIYALSDGGGPVCFNGLFVPQAVIEYLQANHVECYDYASDQS